MSGARDIFSLRPEPLELAGHNFQLRRPSALDLMEALAVGRDTPDRFHCWLVLRHLLDAEGNPVFSSIDEVMNADALMVMKAGKAAEELYGEGRD